jgi:sugar diacid utilization regulator
MDSTGAASELHSAADRLSAIHGEMVEAVLAGSGLQEVASLAARGAGGPVVIVMPRLHLAVAAPAVDAKLLDALQRHVEARVRDRESDRPGEVCAEAPIRAGDELMGGVLLLGDASPTVAQREYLHAAALAALTEAAVEEARLQVQEDLRGSLLEELRARTVDDPAEIIRRAGRLGSDLREGAVALCLELESDRPRHVAAILTGEHPGALVERVEERLYALLPAIQADAERTLDSARRTAEKVRRHGTAGISGFCADPALLSDALDEAELVVRVLAHAPETMREGAMTGTYRLLLRTLAAYPEEIRALYEDTIAPLARYDDQYRTELVGTLSAYLEANCTTNATAATVFAHRHTVAYRLDRIRELTGLDPTRTEDRERLGLGLKAHRLLSPALPR